MIRRKNLFSSRLRLALFSLAVLPLSAKVFAARPIPDAGPDLSITLPVNTVYIASATIVDDGQPVPPRLITGAWGKDPNAENNPPGNIIFSRSTFSYVNVNGLVVSATTYATFPGPGLYHLRLQANDGQSNNNGIANDFVDVTVNSDPNLNNPPTVNAGPDRSIQSPATTAWMQGTASDDGQPVPPGSLTVHWTKVSGPGTVSFTNGGNVANSTATFSQGGIYVLQLSAFDGLQTRVDFATVTYNGTPIPNAGPDVSITNPVNVAFLAGSGIDEGLPNPPGALSYSWVKQSGPGTVTFDNASVAQTSATFSAPGIYVVRLQVSDGQFAAVDRATVTVNSDPALNFPPVVNAGPDISITQPVTFFVSVTFTSATATDDGQPFPPGAMSVTWTKISGPGLSNITNPNVTNATVTFLLPGIYVFQIAASDGLVTSTDTVTVTINSNPAFNQPPTINAGSDKTITLPTNVVNIGQGNPSDDGFPNPPSTFTVTWSVQSGPPGVSFANLHQQSTQATFTNPGIYVLKLVGDDSALQSVNTATITVKSDPSLNLPPVVDAGPDVSITNPVTQAFLAGTATDDGLPIPPGAFTVAWSKISGPGTVTFSSPTVAATTATFSAPGVYVLKILANDTALTSTDTVTVTVNSNPALNNPPVVNAGPDRSIVNPVTQVFLAGTATDDGLPIPPGALTVTWTQLSGPGTVTFTNPSVAATSATFSAPGVYVLQISADDSVATANDTVTVTVNSDPALNQPPVVNAGPDQSIVNPVVTATLNGTATDDGLPIPPGAFTSLWTEVSGPGSVTFVDASAPVTDATFTAPGIYILALTANDSVATSSDTVTITVNSDPALNNPPVVNAGPDLSIVNPVTQVFLAGTATDDGLPIPPGAFTVAWSQLSGPGIVTFTNPSVAATSATFSAPGIYVLQISANDSVASANDTVTVTVNSDPALNQAPVVNAGPDQSIVNPVTSVTLAGTASDDGLPIPPGAFTSSWTQVSGPGTVTFGDPASPATTANFSAPGIYVLELSANDSVKTASDTITITVNSDPALNNPPVVNAGPDLSIVNPVTQVFLAGTATDDGLPIPPGAFTVAWSQVSGPGTVTFTDPTIAATSATFSAPGIYVLQISANDSVASANDTVTVTVNSDPALNIAPVVNAGPDLSIVNPVTQVFLAGTATDDGLPIPPGAFTVAWTQVSGPGTVTFTDPTVAATSATFSAPGIYVLQISANDNALSSADTVTVTVNSDPALNQPPVVDAGPDQSIVNPVTSVNLAGVVSDDGLPIPPGVFTSVWSQVSGPGTVTFGNAAAPATTATFSAPGIYVLELLANDSVATSSDTITITVNSDPALNNAPVVNAGPDLSIVNPVTQVFLAGTATDDGLPIPPGAFTVAWSQVSGPGTVTFVDPTVAATSATFSAPGIYVLQLSANDNALSSTDTVTVTVNSDPALNNAPVVNAGPDLSIVNPVTQVFLAGTATDDGLPIPPGAFTVAWTQVSGPGTATFTDPTVAATSATFSAPGIYVLEISANDSVATASDTVTVVVNSDPALNNAPVVNAGPDLSIVNPVTQAFLAGTATDDGLPIPPGAFTVAWSQVSGPGTVTFTDPTVAGTSATFSAPGIYVLQISANDSVATASDTVTVTVNSDPALNQAPVVNAGPDQSIVNPVTQVFLAGTATDDGLPIPPGAFTVAWSQVSGPGTVTFVDPTVAATSATFSAPGIYVLQILANDSVAIASDTVTITVNSDPSLNQAPVVNAGPDLSIVNPVTQAFLAGTATDDGLPIPPGAFSVAWTQISGPSTATFTDPTVAATSVTFAAPGIYVLQISANDSVASASDTVTVTVNSDPALNQAPVVNAGPDLSIVNPVTQVFLAGTATDDGLPIPPGAFTVTWSQVSGPGTATFTDPTIAATSATFSAPGVYVLEILANDSVASSSDTVTVTVNSDPALNQAPVVNAGPDQSIVNPVNQVFMAGTATDDGLPIPPGAFTVAWSQISGPSTATFTDPTIAATSATFPVPGVYVLEIFANDSVATASDTVIITVNSDPALNNPPVVNAGPDLSIINPVTQAFLAGTATDDGLPIPPGAFTVTWAQVSGPSTATFTDPTVAATSVTFSAPGVYVLQISANDSVATASDTVTVTVNSDPALNQAPVVNAGPDQSITNPVNQVFIAGTATDDGLPIPPGAFTVAWTQISGPSTATFTDPTVAATSATFPVPGVYVLEISANDSVAASSDTVIITVNSDPSLNQAPVVNAGPDLSIVNPVTQVFLAGTATDDGLPNPPAALTVAWSQISGPSTATFTDPTIAATSATFSAPGVYVLQLLANDSVATATDTVIVTVNSDPSLNQPPVVNAGPDQTITNPVNQLFLAGTATDDGLPIPPGAFTVAWTQISGPGAATFTDPTVAATSATFPIAGVYVLQIAANDSVATATDTVTITVNSDPSLNQAPVVNAGPDQSITNPLNQVFIAGTATDDGLPNPPSTFTVVWTQISGPSTATFSDPSVAATSVTFTTPGVYVLQISGNDSVLTSTDSVIVTVNSDPSLNQPPVVNAGPDQTITNPVVSVFLPGTATDDGLPNPPSTLTVAWSQISGPGTVTFASATVAATTATFSAPGVYVLQISGSDSVASATDTVTVTVNSDPSGNIAPVVNAGPDLSITNPTTSVFIAGSATDDGLPNPPSTFTVVWTQLSGPSTATFTDPTVAATSVTFTAPGVYVLQILANDSVLSSTDSVVVTVNSDPSLNQPPVVNAGPDQTITNPVVSVFLPGTATDDGLPNPPSFLTVAWSQISGPGTVSFASATVAATTATFSAPGVYVLQILGSDSVATATDTVTVTVNADSSGNTAPVVNAGPDLSITNPVNQVFIAGTATDDGLPNPPAAINVGWSQLSGPSTATFADPTVAATSVTFTAPGVYVLQILANDSVLSSTDSVVVTVNSDPSLNQSPVVNAGPDQTITNPVVSVFLPGTATDDGLPNPPATLTVAWSQISGPGTVTFASATVAATTATFSAPGVYVLQILGSDSVATATDTVTVTVNADSSGNTAPVVNAGPDLSITNPVNQVFIAGTATDDGLPNPPAAINVGWSQLSGPSTATFADPTVAATSVTFTAPGVYVFQLSASDSVLTSTDSVIVTVNSDPSLNQSPVVNAGPDQTITNPVVSVFLPGTATDDGLPNPPSILTVAWSQLSGPSTATFSDPTVAATTATFSAPGVYVLQILGSDSVATATDTVTITVDSGTAGNLPPVVNAGPDQTITNPIVSVFLPGTATDDGLPNPPATLTVAWSQLSGPSTTTFSDPTVAATTATFSAPGVYVLQILGSDSVLTATDTVTITVDSGTAGNLPPVVNAGPDQTITNPVTQVFIPGTATDDGLPNPPATLTVLWSQLSGPSTTTFSDPTVAATTATFSAPGVYVLQILGSDSVLTATDTVTITVDSGTVGNLPPVVNAGPDLSITNPATQVFIAGTATDDGLPNPPAAINVGWSQVSGPSTATFADPTVAATSVTFTAPGVYVFQISANDTLLVASDTVVVTVNSDPTLNQAPLVNAGPDQTITNPVTSVFLPGTASDDGFPIPPAALIVAWAQVSGPGTATFTDPTVAATTVTFSAPGVYVLRLSGNDGALISSDTATITVNSDPTGNTAPVANAGPDLTITNPVTQAFLAGSATDDGLPNPPATLTYTWSQVVGPGAVTFTNPSVAATSATFPTPGVYLLRLFVSDSVLTSSDTVIVTVNSDPTGNNPPVVNAGPDRSITNPVNQLFINGTSNDDGLPNPPSTLTTAWSQVSGPGTVAFTDPSVAATTVTFPAPGVYVLLLSGSDTLATSSDTVVITVNSDPLLNTPPTVSAGPDRTITNPVTQLFINGTATDDGFPNPPASLAITWSQVSGPGSVSFSNPSVAATTATFPTPGIYVLRIFATDSVFSSSDTVTITVNSNPGSNLAPIVNAGPDRSITNPTTQLTINGSVTDDGLPNPPSILTSAWTQISGPATATFSNPGAPVTNVSFTAPGIYVLQLTGNDTLLTSTDTVVVTVNSDPVLNRAPVVSAGPDQSIVNPVNFVFINGSATDDGFPIPPGAFTVAWTKVSGPGTVTFASPTVAQTTATFSAPGIYVLRITANDSALSANDTVTVTVNSDPTGNQPPVVSAGPDRSITTPVNQALLSGSASDDGLPNPPVQLTVAWSQVSGPAAVTFANPNVAITTGTFPVPGTYVLQLTASDTVLTSSDTMTVIVHPVNQAPTVNAGLDKKIFWPSNQVSINATVTDDGEPVGTLTYAWTVVSGPVGVTLSSPTAEDTLATFPSTGTWVLRLTASDTQLTGFDEVTVNVVLNQKPVVEVGLPPILTWPANTGHLAGSVTDTDGPNPVTALWSFVSGPGLVIFDNPLSADTNAVFFAPGDYVLQLTGFDGIDLESKTLTVSIANAPAPQAPLVGDTVFYPAQGPLSIPLRTNNDGNVRIRVYDILGRLVKDVVNEPYPAGDHVFSWEGLNNESNSLSAGIYILFIEADGAHSKKKIALLK